MGVGPAAVRGGRDACTTRIRQRAEEGNVAIKLVAGAVELLVSLPLAFGGHNSAQVQPGADYLIEVGAGAREAGCGSGPAQPPPRRKPRFPASTSRLNHRRTTRCRRAARSPAVRCAAGVGPRRRHRQGQDGRAAPAPARRPRSPAVPHCRAAEGHTSSRAYGRHKTPAQAAGNGPPVPDRRERRSAERSSRRRRRAGRRVDHAQGLLGLPLERRAAARRSHGKHLAGAAPIDGRETGVLICIAWR